MATAFNLAKRNLFKGLFNVPTCTMKVALMDPTWTPDIDTEDFWSDISAKEITGTGYTAGGQTLTNCTIAVDTVNDWIKFDADDSAWTISGGATMTRLVVYRDTGVAATSPLLFHANDGGFPQLASGGLFTVTWSSNGLVRLT